jgi:hypothetical protein
MVWVAPRVETFYETQFSKKFPHQHEEVISKLDFEIDLSHLKKSKFVSG